MFPCSLDDNRIEREQDQMNLIYRLKPREGRWPIPGPGIFGYCGKKWEVFCDFNALIYPQLHFE